MISPAGYGLYVHVPYCRKRCPYCHFHLIACHSPPAARFVQAVQHEFQARSHLFAGPPTTLYVGGGTPSLLGVEPLLHLLHMAQQGGLPLEAEATLEVEPGTLTLLELRALRQGGYNRVSVGVQSSSDERLVQLGRQHDSAMAAKLLHDVRQAGFERLNMDLMFALPGQTLEQLTEDIDHLVEIRPDHISLYALTYHEGTVFWRWRQEGRLVPVDEVLEAEMMEHIHDELGQAGYERYEISNYALPHARCQHNQGYWRYKPYLGLGPSACSFWRDRHTGQAYRWKVPLGPSRYLEQYALPQPPSTWAELAQQVDGFERCSTSEQLLEYAMGALRTLDGMDLCQPLLASHLAHILPILHQLRRQGWLWWQGTCVGATAQGMMIADTLALAFAQLPIPDHAANLGHG